MTTRIFTFMTLLVASLVMGEPGTETVSSPSAKRYAFTIHPISSLSVSGVNVSFEGPLGDDRWAYEVPLYLGYNQYSGNTALFITGSGLGVRRYLLEGGAGTYISPEIDVVNLHASVSSSSSGSTAGNLLIVMPSLRLGYKARWDYFTLDTGFGFQFVKAYLTAGTSNDVSSDVNFNVAFLTPMFSFALGIPF